MQFKNTSDVTLRTDKNTHPIRGKLHAELGNDQQHTRTPGTADERHQAITTRISHIIYLGHFLRCAKNVAIPTMQVQYLNETKGNYVRNCSAHPSPDQEAGHHPRTQQATQPTHAEKSLQNQHVLSILQVGSHHLQHQLFRTNKPKSRHKTNTFCPLTLFWPLGPFWAIQNPVSQRLFVEIPGFSRSGDRI